MQNNTLIKKSLAAVLVLLVTLVRSQQWNGLTYYSNSNSTTGYLIDTNSNVVKTFNFTGGTGYSTHFMPGGTMFRTVMNPGNVLTGGGMTGRIQKVDYNGTILWDYTYSSSTYCLHHDHCPLPNGNVLVISYDVKSAAETGSAGATSSIIVWSEKIMELRPVGTNSATVVWEWKFWDHLVQNVDPLKANYKASIIDNPQLMNINYNLNKDWIHMNGVEYNPMLDQISISCHNLNEWFIIDHSTTTAEAAAHTGGLAGKGGDFLYRWGNPNGYGATGTKILNVTHDAHWIPEGSPYAGNLAGINNRGITTPASKTTVDMIIIPRKDYNYTITPGSAYSPSSYSSRKVGVGYTTNMGSSQEFPNGNQLICLATIGTIYEIDSLGNTLWTKSTGGTVAQSHRYSACYLNNPAPAQPSITVTNSILGTTPAASYQWYFNGNLISGATSQTYSPTQMGIYLVRTTDINGCVYVYSPGYNYSITPPPPPPPVDETGITTQALNQALSIFPNPANDKINIQMNGIETGSYTVRLVDAKGQLIFSATNTSTIDVSELPSGFYTLNLTVESEASVNKKVIIIK